MVVFFFPQWHLKYFFFFVFKCFCSTYINIVLTPKIYSRVTLDKGKTLVWEIRLALFVITVLFTDPGCCSTHSSGKQEFSSPPPQAAVEIKIKKTKPANLQDFNSVFRNFFLNPRGCWELVGSVLKNLTGIFLFLKYSLFADAWFWFNSSVLLNYKVKWTN